GAKVIIGNTPGAFPTTHPLFFGECEGSVRADVRDAVKKADVILALEYVDIGGTLQQIFPPGVSRDAKIINCSMEQQMSNGWVMDYHVLPIADITFANTTEALTAELNRHLRPETAANIGSRCNAFSVPEMPTGSGEIGIRDLAAVFLNITAAMDIS